MPPPAILCDIGNVIVHFDFTIASRRLAAWSDLPAEAVLPALEGIKGPFEDGQMDDASFVTAASAAIGFRGKREDFIRAWCEIFTANAPMIKTLERLHRTRRLYLLSNTSGLHKDYLFASFPVFNLFQGGVYSYSERASKPGRRIFEAAIEQFDLEPEQTFYIDDLLPNIETAKSLRFATHHYHSSHHQELAGRILSNHPTYRPPQEVRRLQRGSHLLFDPDHQRSDDHGESVRGLLQGQGCDR